MRRRCSHEQAHPILHCHRLETVRAVFARWLRAANAATVCDVGGVWRGRRCCGLRFIALGAALARWHRDARGNRRARSHPRRHGHPCHHRRRAAGDSQRHHEPIRNCILYTDSRRHGGRVACLRLENDPTRNTGAEKMHIWEILTWAGAGYVGGIFTAPWISRTIAGWWKRR